MRINDRVDETWPRLRGIRRSSVIDQQQERVNTPSRASTPSPMNIPHKQSDSTNFTDGISAFVDVLSFSLFRARAPPLLIF